jgi:leucyl-tRNA synthetase
MPRYSPETIESKWQSFWNENKTFKTPNPGDAGFDLKKPKFYALDMFPYPSGDGLHVGHPEGYTATDILSRYKRMQGFNVLHPMGWDSFGLPAEQYAIKTGQHPAITTASNVTRFKAQIQRLGFSYDWDREIATSDPVYYRWTQWIFRKLFEKGLAYQAEVPVWWCEELGTVLANEEVDADGKSEVGGFSCVRRNMRQWMLKITAYADRLLSDLDGLDWPDGIKKMQADWIGKSEGADVKFEVSEGPGHGQSITVFTTRPDTLYGATYVVLAPEHPMVSGLVTAEHAEAVRNYVDAASRKSELERKADTKEKSGVFTGAYAINPVNGKPAPIWIADYVLASYGTGAIMAVPAHDERDFDFAMAFHLPVIEVVRSAGQGSWVRQAERDGQALRCMTEEGVAIHSPLIEGMPTSQAKQKITEHLEAQGLGKKVVRYKLRDWLFSRQRYWGEPFPVYFDKDGKAVLADESELPIVLPELESYKPTGTFEPPLSKAKDWVNTPKGRRETNVMPQWAGSCWYYLRYMDAGNAQAPWGAEAERYWMPVDLYIGGAEHAVLHLLYARFWHKVFFDLGMVHTQEPFQKLFNQGMIVGTAYKTASGSVVKTADVEWKEGKPHHPVTGEALAGVHAKMSKSLGNVINPDDIVREFGADSLRLYEMFMGPLDAGKVWDTQNIQGVFRFLKRSFHLISGDDHSESACKAELLTPSAGDPLVEKALHRCIRSVTQDLEGLRFNTGIAAMMTFLNEIKAPLSKDQAERYVLVLAPYAPHLGEELWQRLGHTKSLAYEPWPVFSEALCGDDVLELVVQINGKVRAKIIVPPDASEQDCKDAALSDPKVIEVLKGAVPKKVVVVPKKLVSLVV